MNMQICPDAPHTHDILNFYNHYIFSFVFQTQEFKLVPLLHNDDNAYRNDPKFLDRLVWANSADPDQTAPRGAV